MRPPMNPKTARVAPALWAKVPTNTFAHTPSRLWAVVIDGKREGVLWGRYGSRTAALAVDRQLRQIGIAAHIENIRAASR